MEMVEALAALVLAEWMMNLGYKMGWLIGGLLPLNTHRTKKGPHR